MSIYGGGIFENHEDMLAASGITPDHAHDREYRSVDTKVRLNSAGISTAGRRIPGLLIPMRDVNGSVWGYQYRPDNPRLNAKGKPIKYETPVGQRNGIDVPPGVGPQLADPSIPLWITEGTKKADCGAVNGLCIVALPGVWSWRGKNNKGGRTAIPDWNDVALNGRTVILAFDGDVARKPSVRSALSELSGYLANKGAQVAYCWLPDEDDKVGLDDYLMAGHAVNDLLALVHPDLPPEREPVEPVEPIEPVQGETPPETGSVLLDVRRWLSRYINTVSDGDLDILTLWAAHTHLVMETYTTPRLVLDSPVPESGKTTTLEHLERLCVHPVQMASLSSPALLTRMLDAGMRTILVDEADRSLDPKREGVEELLAVLNSGYKRGGTRPVLTPTKDGWAVSEMPTYSPVVMAGNNPNLPEDTKSRTIRVLLMPDIRGRAMDSDWELIEDDAKALGGRLARWADSIRDSVRTERPDMPEGIRGRMREKWFPLKRVAHAAGGRWPEVVDALALHDLESLAADREDGMFRDRPAVVLLRHIHELWPQGCTFWETRDMIEGLVMEYPDMWGSSSPFGKALTSQRMGRMLVSAYKVNSGRVEHGGPRGYTWGSLAPAWRALGIEEADDAEEETVPDPVEDVQGEPLYPHGVPGLRIVVNNDDADEDPEPGPSTPPSETGSTGSSGSTGSARPVPESEMGPCLKCGTRHHRYGDGGMPMCPTCRQAVVS